MVNICPHMLYMYVVCKFMNIVFKNTATESIIYWFMYCIVHVWNDKKKKQENKNEWTKLADKNIIEKCKKRFVNLFATHKK